MGIILTEKSSSKSVSDFDTNGGVWINDIYPTSSGNVGNKTTAENNTVLLSCVSDTSELTVVVIATTGKTHVRPVVTVNNKHVVWDEDQDVSRYKNFWRGEVSIVLVGDVVTAVHEDGAVFSCEVLADPKPLISIAEFTGGYPGSQTELKAGDVFDIRVVADLSFSNIQVDNNGAFTSVQTKSCNGTDCTETFIIGNRGTTVQDLGARVRVQKNTGTWSNWVWTNISGSVDGVNTVKLNNLYPSVETMNQSSITYPANQEAIKDNESVTVHSTCSNYDTIIYSSPNGQLTIPNPNTYQENKNNISRNNGDYNVSVANYRISCNRAANDATTTKDLVVYIAHTFCTVTMSETGYLRSGGNDGTSIQSHTITLTSNQILKNAPTIGNPPAGGGTWSGDFIGGPMVWTRTLQISDDDTKGTYAYQTLSAVNLANKETTSYTGDSNYTIRGFVSRNVTLAAYANEASMNTAATIYANVVMTWSVKSLPNKRPVGTTDVPDANSWCLHTLDTTPTIIRILDTAATGASSVPTTITIEETV